MLEYRLAIKAARTPAGGAAGGEIFLLNSSYNRIALL